MVRDIGAKSIQLVGLQVIILFAYTFYLLMQKVKKCLIL